MSRPPVKNWRFFGSVNPPSRPITHLQQLILNASRGQASTSAAGAIWSRRLHLAAGKQASSLGGSVYSEDIADQTQSSFPTLRHETRRSFAAAAHAVAETDHSQQHPNHSSPINTPSKTPRPPFSKSKPPDRARQPLRAREPWNPIPLPAEGRLKQRLLDRTMTPAEFCAEFHARNLQPEQLAWVLNLKAIWDIWTEDPELDESSWGFLAHQFGRLDISWETPGIDWDIPDLVHAIQGYALWKLGRHQEAKSVIDGIGWHSMKRKEVALVALIRSITLTALGDQSGAQRSLTIALRYMISGYSGPDFSAANMKLVQQIFGWVDLLYTPSDFAEVIFSPSLVNNLLRQSLNKGLSPGEKDLLGIVHQALAKHDAPMQWLSQRIAVNPGAKWMGSVFLIAKLVHTPGSAFAFYEELLDNRISVDRGAVTRLLEILLIRRELDQATVVAGDLRKSPGKPSHRALTALLGYSEATSDTDAVRQLWSSIVQNYQPSFRDKVIYTRGVVDLRDLAATQTQVQTLFGKVDHPEALNLLLKSAVQANNIEFAEQVFDRIRATNLNINSCNTMLSLYAANGNADAAVELFDDILDWNIRPNVASFTSLIALFGNRRDIENARNVFGLMHDARIDPDSAAYTAMLNAEVEAGEWKAAAERWGMIHDKELQNSPSVISVILKAYVLLSVPTKQVLGIFRRVERPTSYIWALAIQSAADNNDLDLAQSLFAEMDDASRLVYDAPAPAVYHFSILLHAFMRLDRKEQARGIYEEMLTRGILPTSVTYGMILSAFRYSGAPGFEQAARFAASIHLKLQEQSEAPRGRGTVSENIFGPLVNMSADSGRIFDAAAYMEHAMGIAPTVPIYTRLMDAYRQAGQTDLVMKAWTLAFELACSSTKEKVATAIEVMKPSRTRSNILCVPLSIVLDALASAGRYIDIRQVWESVQSAGFGFDSQNYNHYAAALARTGDLDRAFAVVQDVLLPRWEEVKYRRHLGLREDGPNMRPPPPEVESLVSDLPVQGPFRPPNRRHEQRWSGTGTDSHEATTSPDSESALVDNSLLRQWRPSDTGWRPSHLTVSVLEHAFSQLQTSDRRAWIALGAADEDADPEDMDDRQEKAVVTLPSFGDVPVRDVDGSVQRTTPRAIIFRLHRKYAKAMALVLFHRRQRASRQRRQGAEAS